MKRAIKILGVLGALVLLLAVAAALWATWFLDVDVYRQQLIERTRQYTGRELTLPGELSVDIFPRIALQTGPMALAARPGFGDAPMVEARDVSIAVQLWPLLRGEVRIDRIALDAPRLRLGVTENGDTAWGDMVSRAARESGHDVDVSDGEALGAGAAALVVQGVKVRDGEVHWHDAARGTDYAVTGIELSVDRIRHGEPGRFELSGRLQSAALPGQTRVELRGEITADFQTFDADVRDIEVEVAGEAFDAMLSVGELRLHGLRDAGTATAADLSLRASRGDIALELTAQDLAYRVSEDTLSVPSFNVNGAGVTAGGELTVFALTQTPSAKLTLRTQQLDPARLLAAAGVDAAWLDAEAAADASLSAELTVDAASLSGENVVARVGGSDLAASFTVGLGEPRTLDARLDSERLDIDALLADNDGSGANSGAAAAPLAAPVGILRSFHGAIEARVASLVSGGVTYADLRVDARADGDSVVVEPLQATVAGGRLAGTLSVGKADPPPISARLSMDGVDAGELLASLALTERLAGRGSLRLDLSARGLAAAAIRRSLDGSVSVDLQDGLVRGVDISRILAAARGGDLPAGGATDGGGAVTRFSRFEASMTFQEGIGRNRDLRLVGDDFRVDGEGVIDLPGNNVDYRLAIFLANSDASTADAPAYEPVPIPLRIAGDLDAPGFSIDAEALLKAEAERQVRREAAERGIDAPDAKSAVKEYLRSKLEQSLD